MYALRVGCCLLRGCGALTSAVPPSSALLSSATGASRSPPVWQYPPAPPWRSGRPWPLDALCDPLSRSPSQFLLPRGSTYLFEPSCPPQQMPAILYPEIAAAKHRFRVRQGRFLLSICARRAFTSFFTSAAGSGLSVGNWMVPFDMVKPLSSFLNASITDDVGNKLQCLENAANHTSTCSCLNAG